MAESYNDAVHRQICNGIKWHKDNTDKKEVIVHDILDQYIKNKLSADGYMIMQDNVQKITTIMWT